MSRALGWAVAVVGAALLAWLLRRDMLAESLYGRELVNIELGLWASRLLIVTLAISPLSVMLREPGLRRVRRPLGVATAVFTIVHAVQYAIYAGPWPSEMAYIFVTPYLLIGVIASVPLMLMAATSSNRAVSWLGPWRWGWLHRGVYGAAILVAVHELMAGAEPLGEAGAHGLLIALLLGWRAGTWAVRPR
jgi:sulfoxide reductase heme-binding subunit YedZ